MEKNKKYDLPIVLVYIISMAFTFTTLYGDIKIGYKFQIIIGLIWIIVILIKMIVDKFSFKQTCNRNIVLFLLLYLAPLIVIHLYTIIGMMFGRVPWKYFTSNLTVYVPTALAILSIYLFRKKTLIYTLYALLLSWIISVTVSFITKGVMIFPNAIYQGYINPESSLGHLKYNYLELHDLVLACGYPFIYFLFSNRYLERNNKYIFISMIVIMFLGMKRIAVIGLILTFIFYPK